MIKFLLAFALIMSFAVPAQAVTLEQELSAMQSEWARIKYGVSDKQKKLSEIAKLGIKAEAITKNFPKSAEAKIWEAIILATDANITKGLGALSKVEKAKALLEESLKINPKAMEGAAHMTLGSLYFQVPGWPVGFGSDKLAEDHFKKALAISPGNLDTNYWYGEFMMDQGRPAEAIKYYQTADKAPIRKNRHVADEGRKREVHFSLNKAYKENTNKAKGNE
jgi:tetratricopeptide (TPR) repeat protein